MELREIAATNERPYRCYVRGNSLQSEGENVYTVGFKDGLAVVQIINPPHITDMQKMRDKAIGSKGIDLTKLKKIIVKIDPQSGKKYIVKDGKKIEIVPQVGNPVLNFKPINQPSSAEEQIRRNIIIKKPQLVNAPIVKSALVKKPNVISPQNTGMKVIDNVKYHVLSLKVKKQGEVPKSATVSTMTDYDLSVTVDKKLQTDSLDRKDSSTQTELSSGRDSPFSELFYNFILGEGEYNDRSSEMSNKKAIDPSKLKTKEEINKFNFFNDMRNALTFDRSGNLPIHDSVMQNNVKAVKRNCIVLRAIQETLNIVNQQGYAPLHLAILFDVSLEVVKILLNQGADLNVADSEGNTAIHLAIENKRSQALKILVSWAPETNFNFDIFNYEGFTPLILACLNRSYDDAKLLLEHKADPNVRDMKSGRTALFHAAECFDVDLVELLMEYKADTKIRNFFGTSPHDAMFEVEDMPLKIKFCILGRDHQRLQKKKIESARVSEAPLKKAKLQTTPVLRKLSANDFMFTAKKK